MAGTLNFINEQLEKLRQERIVEEKALWTYKSNTRFETVDTGISSSRAISQPAFRRRRS